MQGERSWELDRVRTLNPETPLYDDARIDLKKEKGERGQGDSGTMECLDTKNLSADFQKWSSPPETAFDTAITRMVEGLLAEDSGFV